MNKLTKKQKEIILQDMINTNNAIPVLFKKRNKLFNIYSGATISKTDIKNIYYYFSKKSAEKIAKWLNCRVVFITEKEIENALK